MGKHNAAVNTKTAQLAFAISAVEMNMKNDFLFFKNVEAKTLSSLATPYGERLASFHLSQKGERDFENLVVYDIFTFPDRSKHQDSFIA